MSDAPTPTSEAPDSLIGLINLLVEPPEPAPVSMMPQTWGWAVLALLLALLLAWGVWRWLLHRRRNAYRRAALDELSATGTTAGLAAILRRAALVAYPRTEVAALSGPSWVAFLNGSSAAQFSEALGNELRHAVYREDGVPPSTELRTAAERWLRTHRAEGAR